MLPEYEVRIARSEASIDADRSGEVLIRGGNVLAGDWRDDAATRATLRDGWLHTGDIGEFDDGGNLHIVGRIKDVIRSGSSTIVPNRMYGVMRNSAAVAGRGDRSAGRRMGQAVTASW